MSQPLDTLAIELAAIAKQVGVRKSDLSGLKALIESLAVQDAQKSIDQQKGYARIVRTYKPSGYTRLHNLVLKYWQEDKVKELPEIPAPTDQEDDEHTCHSFLLTLAEHSDMLRICQYITNHVSNILGVPVTIRSVSKISANTHDFVVCGAANPMAVLEIITGVGGVLRAKIRSKYDYESQEIETPLLQWEVPDFVPITGPTHAST